MGRCTEPGRPAPPGETPLSMSVIQNPIIGATPCISGTVLRKSRDTPQKVIKEQRLSWKN